jgi:DNA polymerase III delta prime subunit
MDRRRQVINERYGTELFLVEKKSNTYGVEDIRELRKVVSLRGQSGRNLVVVFYDGHLLSEIAQNMLLSILESETAENIFVFECQSEEQFLPTIRSRAQLVFVPDSQSEEVQDFKKYVTDLEEIVRFSESVTDKLEMQKVVSAALSWMRNEVRQNSSAFGLETLRELNEVVNEFVHTNVQPRLAIEVILIILYKYCQQARV